jgi:predicted alpha/beta-fold hydrolase
MITSSKFRPAWWLPGPHLQTLYPSLLRRRGVAPLRRQRMELPDGDFIDIDWTATAGSPRILVLHGLEGSLDSHYSGALLALLARHGYRAGLMYFRGRSGEPNRLARSYHSGDTADLDFVVRSLAASADLANWANRHRCNWQSRYRYRSNWTRRPVACNRDCRASIAITC